MFQIVPQALNSVVLREYKSVKFLTQQTLFTIITNSFLVMIKFTRLFLIAIPNNSTTHRYNCWTPFLLPQFLVLLLIANNYGMQ